MNMIVGDLLDAYYYVSEWYDEICEENNKEEKDKYQKELELIIRKIKEAVNDNI